MSAGFHLHAIGAAASVGNTGPVYTAYVPPGSPASRALGHLNETRVSRAPTVVFANDSVYMQGMPPSTALFSQTRNTCGGLSSAVLHVS